MSHKTERECHRTWVDVLVYTATDFWVKTFIFCDNKWVLNCSIQTQTEVVVQKSRPSVAERDVVATHEACVLHEVVACALCQVDFLKQLSVCHQVADWERRCRRNRRVANLNIVKHVVADACAQCETEIPVLEVERVGPVHCHLRILAVVHILIVRVNHAVTVAVNKHTFDSLAVLIVNLLVNIEAACRISHFVSKHCTACTCRDTVAGSNEVILVVALEQFCNLVLVPSHVVRSCPSEVLLYNWTGSDCEFNTDVLQRTDVGVHCVGKV